MAQLSDNQRAELERHGLLYAEALQRAVTRINQPIGPQSEAEAAAIRTDPGPLIGRYRALMADAHIVAVLLRHLYEISKKLSEYGDARADRAKAAQAFRTAYDNARIKDMRDVLEHAPEYITGDGQRPGLKVSDVPFTGAQVDGIGMMTWTVFGKSYEMGAVVASAFAFATTLGGRR